MLRIRPHLLGPTPMVYPDCACEVDWIMHQYANIILERPSSSNSIYLYSWLVWHCVFRAHRHVAIDWDFQFSCTGLAENRNPFLSGAGHQFLIFFHVSNCRLFLFSHWNFKAAGKTIRSVLIVTLCWYFKLKFLSLNVNCFLSFSFSTLIYHLG